MGLKDNKQNDNNQKYQVDESLLNGPISNRHCNDIFCCMLFFLNLAALIAIGAYGYSKGHPDRLLVPYDSDGRACGKDASVQDYKYVYLPYKTLDRSVCLKTCPTDVINSSTTVNSQASISWAQMKYQPTLSALTSNPTPYSVPYYQAHPNLPTDQSVVLVYQTKGLFGRVCLPYGSSIEYIQTVILNPFGGDSQSIEKYISDLKTGWGTILGSIGIAFVISFIYMVFLRYCAGLMTWLSVLTYFACLIGLAILLLRKGREKQEQGKTEGSESKQNDGKYLQYTSYGVFAFAGLCVLIFLCLFNRIRQAIAIIKSSALFVAEVKSTLYVPPVVSLVNMGFIAWWIVVYVYVYSVGDITGSENGPFASVKWQKNVRYILIYHIFGGLWINSFFGALLQFILATACAIWYFSKPSVPHKPVYQGLVRGLTYHLGSLAFGSLILALVQLIRLILEFVHKQVKKSDSNENSGCSYCINCLRCYSNCFERFIQFMNKNAYIQMAITGKSFCSSARDALELVWTNPAKFGVIATIGGIFIFIGRVFIGGATGLICYAIFINVDYYEENLFSPILPTVFCVIIGYLIGTFFMSIYGMGIDSILQCSCLDEQLMKKTGKDPDRCPAPLKEYFNRQRK